MSCTTVLSYSSILTTDAGVLRLGVGHTRATQQTKGNTSTSLACNKRSKARGKQQKGTGQWGNPGGAICRAHKQVPHALAPKLGQHARPQEPKRHDTRPAAASFPTKKPMRQPKTDHFHQRGAHAHTARRETACHGVRMNSRGGKQRKRGGSLPPPAHPPHPPPTQKNTPHLFTFRAPRGGRPRQNPAMHFVR